MNKNASTDFRPLWLNDQNFSGNGTTRIEKFSDKELYDYCKKVGYNARILSRRFIATLPEVAKRRLYKKYGYCSIREFASKLAGVSHDNVDEVLRVSEKFKELPKMKALIGEVGLSKLRVVACVANKENEKELAEKVRKMTKSSLEIYIREMFRKSGRNTNQNFEKSVYCLPGEANGDTATIGIPQGQKQIGLFDDDMNSNENVANPQNHDKRTFTIQIDQETEFELRKFRLQLEKERKEPIDWNFTLKEMVKRISSEKVVQLKNLRQVIKPASAAGVRIKPAKEIQKLIDAGENYQMELANLKPVSRYIPAKIKQDLQQKYKSHCSYHGCNKPAEQIHHQERFAQKRAHQNLVPLCKIHHDFVHQNFIEPRNIKIDKIFNTYKMKYCS